MSRHTWRRRAATLTACAVTALGGATAAGSAHADGGPVLQMTAASAQVGLAVPPDGDGQVSWGLDTQGNTIHDLKVTVDITGISSFVDTPDDYCVDGLCTWHFDEVGEHGTGSLVDISPKAGAKLGSTGTAVISGTASDATIKPFDVQVTVGQVGLVVNGIPKVDDAKPGSTITAPVTLANTGSLVSATTDYTFTVSPGLKFAQHFSNCDYGTTDKEVESVGVTLQNAVCHFTTPVEPGKKYQLSTPLQLKVAKSALYEFLDYAPKSTSSTVPNTVRGNAAGALSLVPDGDAPHSGSQHSQWIVNAVNTADLAVTGDKATGKPGTEVTLTATIRNLGPADVYLATNDDQLSLEVDIPKGTTAVKVPSACGPWTPGAGKGEPKLGAPQYLCDLDRPFDAGHSQKLSFTVKVNADAPATTTSDVKPQLAYTGEPPYDTDKSNSTGHFTVTVPGGATSTGGSGSTGGTSGGSTGNSPGTQTGSSAGSTAGAGTEPNGSLASTGSNGTMTIAWTGAAALAAGGAVFAFVRSRRLRARA